MKLQKITRIVWLFIYLSLITILMVMPVQAQEIVFTESFDDPAFPGWEHSENAQVNQGVLQIAGGGFAYYGNPWHNLSLTIRINHPGSGETRIHYRDTDAGSYILRIGADHIAVNRQTNGEDVELVISPNPVLPNNWFKINITADGENHTVNLNDNEIFSFSDPNQLPPGGIGLRYQGEETVTFDDLSVALISSPPAEDQEPALGEEPTQTGGTEPGEVNWIYTGGPPGGLGYDIRYKPSDPTTWYVTDAFAGAFISTDDGHTWQPINQGIKGQSGPSGDWFPVFSLTIDPHDNNIIWIGTQNTGHIYKSTDGGASWVQKDTGVTIKYHALSFRGFTIDPRSSDIVYAMAETTRNDPNPDETGGQIYKTTDGGENWELIWDGGMPSALARYLWINPDNPDVMYASTGIFDRGAVGGTPTNNFDAGIGILKSTDGGEIWRSLDRSNGLELMHIGSLFMHPNDPDILLAAAGHLTGDDDLMQMEQQGFSIAGIYRSNDGGESWQRMLEAPITRPNEAFSSVEICLSDPNVAYAGSEYAVYRSSDAGENWQLVSGGDQGWGPPGVLAGWPIDMQCDSEDPNRIFANNYLGGNFLSEDGGKTWVNASQGYTGAHMLSLAIDPDEPGKLFASGRSGYWVTYTGGSSWIGVRPKNTNILSIDTGVISIDPSDHNHLISGGRNIFGLVESYDGGQTWQDIWQLKDSGIEHFFTRDMIPTAIAFAISNPEIIYLGGAHETGARSHEPYFQGVGVLISKDGGKTFTQTTDPDLSQLATFDIAVSPGDANVAYATTSQGVYKTMDGGISWTLLNMKGENNWVWTIAMNPQDPNYLIAGVEQLGPQISMDGGSTWQIANVGWEVNGSPSAFVFDPDNPQIVYMGDYFSGAYKSDDGGLTWKKMNQGLIIRNILDLVISHDGEHLYAGTFGGGVFRLDLTGKPPAESVTPVVGGVVVTEEGREEQQPEEMTEDAAPQKSSDQPASMVNIIIGIVIALVVIGVVILLLRRKPAER